MPYNQARGAFTVMVYDESSELTVEQWNYILSRTKQVSIFDKLRSTPLSKSTVEEPKLSLDRVTGKIIHVNKAEGYGFITSEEVPFTRIFFHWQGLLQDTLKFLELEKGMKVEFTPTIVDGKDRAIKVKVVN